MKMNNQINSYDIKMNFDLEKKLVDVDVNLKYMCTDKSTQVLNFYLHKDFEVEEISCDRPIKYEVSKEIANWSPFIVESKLISIYPEDMDIENQFMDIKFRYKCHKNFITPSGVNRITKEWVELGLYSPWFPLSEKQENALFNVKIKIDDGYKVINAHKGEDYFIIDQPYQTFDCTIIASNEIKVIDNHKDKSSIKVYYSSHESENIANKIYKYGVDILKVFNDRFGSIDNNNLSVVITPRNEGGGYCRTGLIVLCSRNSLENEVWSFSGIAHEIAHLWWRNADINNTWEDWLNESFAEFSSLLAVREEFGQLEFNKKIDEYKEVTKDLPPIKNMPRNHKDAYKVLYMKGSVILNNLMNTIGEEKFNELLLQTHLNKISNTEAFLNKLQELTDETIRLNFETLLSK